MIRGTVQTGDQEEKSDSRPNPGMMHSELLPSVGTSSSFFSSNGKAASSPRLSSRVRSKQGFDGGFWGRNVGSTTGLKGRQNVKDGTFEPRDSGLFKIRVSDKKNSSSSDGNVYRIGEEDDVGVVQVLDRGQIAQRGGRGDGGERGDGVVNVQVEKLANNSRKIEAKITIGVPLDVIWAILTDYEHLADFFPGLAVNKLLEKKHDGARLYQVGEQNLAFGLKFKAKAIVDCTEKPSEVRENVIQRDIDFETVEGDFHVFRGTWRMEQQPSKTSSASRAVRGEEAVTTTLSYILVVQPKVWLPVALVEGRLTSEMKVNLVCIRDISLRPSVRLA